MRVALLVAWITLSLVACGPSAQPPPTAAPTALPVPPESAALVDAALTDAAGHLNVARDTISVEQVTPQDWPDSSLGCPRPGEMYSQVVTPGYLIVVTGAGRRLEYHTDDRARVQLCSET